MPKFVFLHLFYFSNIFIFAISLFCSALDEDRKVYIVYMGSLHEGQYSPSSHHFSMIQEVVGGGSAANYLIRSYGRSFNGFVAKLTDEEREKLAGMNGVVSVFPSKILQLQTTRSWDFMGFNETVNRKPTVESNVIVGVIDTGIWPESASFSDEGFGPAPRKWKGACEGGKNFTCNNKIIGARYYSLTDSARDFVGHGTHTASTAAGNIVKDASFYGLGSGTARGGVPSARIAAYSVCADSGCSSQDILAAFDDAIADGVDIITISIGAQFASDFDSDPIAIGAFHSMEKGILTVNSAGNNGPGSVTTSSIAPWMLSVAASTSDRRFIDKVVLGNGKTLVGNSINSFTLNGTGIPLTYGMRVSEDCPKEYIGSCLESCLDSKMVKGKLLLCNFFDYLPEAHKYGARGSILGNSLVTNVSFVVSLPASALKENDYGLVKSYMNSTRNPVANILKSEVVRDKAAPEVISFSSRGPSSPDISGPGVEILAAYSEAVPPSGIEEDERRVKYNVLSGTSMSCPHAAGSAAYVKTFHPDWSPSAIKSALMTTAWPMKSSLTTDAEFGYGSGHINPVEAINPGLVYETFKEDYVTMLCSLGYDDKRIRSLTGDNSTCPEGSRKTTPKDLNYPSMGARVTGTESFNIQFHRTVTNVGVANSTYKAKVFPNSKLNIRVVPEVLAFKSLNEKKSFNVTVSGGNVTDQTVLSASLVWSDGSHSVRSPIIVHTAH